MADRTDQSDVPEGGNRGRGAAPNADTYCASCHSHAIPFAGLGIDNCSNLLVQIAHGSALQLRPLVFFRIQLPST